MLIEGVMFDLEVYQSEVTGLTEANLMAKGQRTEELAEPLWHLADRDAADVLKRAAAVFDHMEDMWSAEVVRMTAIAGW